MYEALAVDALGDFLDANVANYLAAAETRFGLAGGTLAEPVQIVRGFVPNDNRSPLVTVWADAGDYAGEAGQRHKLQGAICSIGVGLNGSVDVPTFERYAWLYLGAIRHALESKPQLDGADFISVVLPGASGRSYGEIDTSMVRHTRSLGVEVRVHDTGQPGVGAGVTQPALGMATVASSPYTVLDGNDVLLVTANPATINLQQISGSTIRILRIKDRAGEARAANPITIAAFAGDTIDGEASYLLEIPYSSITLVGTGSDWAVI